MLTDKGYELKCIKGDWYQVKSTKGRVYLVNIKARTCDCADYAWRGPDHDCKHLMMIDQLIKGGVTCSS